MQIYEDSLKFWARAGDLHGGLGDNKLWLSAEVATLHDELPMCPRPSPLPFPVPLLFGMPGLAIVESCGTP